MLCIVGKNKSQKSKKVILVIADFLIWGGLILVIIGLGYEAFNYPWRTLFQDWGWVSTPEDLPTPKSLSSVWLEEEPTLVNLSSLPQESRTLERPPAQLQMVGIIKLPKIGISDNIVSGVNTELYYAVGHMPGTALPGQEGNCVLAGHRNYIPSHPFRHLDKLQSGDAIIVEDKENRYTYQVFQSFVVKPSDVWIIEPVDNEKNVVTLITCTPVLTMTERLIVRGRLIDTKPLPAAEF